MGAQPVQGNTMFGSLALGLSCLGSTSGSTSPNTTLSEAPETNQFWEAVHIFGLVRSWNRRKMQACNPSSLDSLCRSWFWGGDD